MDDRERIARVEAEVESHKEQLDRIEQELIRQRVGNHQSFADLREHTDRGLTQLREHTDRSLAELRGHTDQGLAELREHTDRRLAELRQHTDQGFAELRAGMEAGMGALRAEMVRSTRWQIGTTITLAIAVLGMLTKLIGVV